MKCIVLAITLSLAGCQSCGPSTPIESAQKFVPEYGFVVDVSAAGSLEAYPHALYYSGQGSASASFARRGVPLYTLRFAPGAAQFHLITVDPDSGKVRLLATTCAEAHARGHFGWIPCATAAGKKSSQRPAGVILEYDPETATTTKPGGCGSCPVDSSGACCCPDVVTGFRCPSATDEPKQSPD